MSESEYAFFTGRCRKCGDLHVNRYVIYGKTGRMKAEGEFRAKKACSHGVFRLKPVAEGLMVVW